MSENRSVFPEPLVTLTFRQAVNEAKRAIREKGWDYIYEPGIRESCHNFEQDGAPSCIVGHMLSYKGMTLEDITGIRHPDNGFEIPFNERGVYTMGMWGVVEMTSEAQIFLSGLQSEQDDGQTWGESYITALRNVYQLRKLAKK